VIAVVENINKGQRSKSIYKREQSIRRKLAGMSDNAIQIAFTFYVIAIAAKLASVEANNTTDISTEIESFKEIFSIPASEKDKVEEFYRDAIHDSTAAKHYAKQLLNLFPGNKLILEELVDDLLVFADADSPMTSGKVHFLKEIILSLHFNEKYFRGVLRKHLLNIKQNPFELLDVNTDISYVELKKKYRNAVKDWHPDKFSAENIAPELAEIAREQFDLYSKAYEAIKLKRGFSQ